VSALESAAEDAVPNADCAQRALAGEQEEGQVTGSSGVGLVPVRKLDVCRVDLLQVSDQWHAQVARSAATAEDERVHRPEPSRQRHPLGIGDDPPHLAERRLASDIAVRAQEHRHGADAAERDGQRERARAGSHQHADVLALAHADRDQSAHDVVDPIVGRAGVVGAVLEQ
jgi:hypothetical protein